MHNDQIGPPDMASIMLCVLQVQQVESMLEIYFIHMHCRS